MPVALVTRNTTSAVNAFFSLLGEEWRPLFSQASIPPSATLHAPCQEPSMPQLGITRTQQQSESGAMITAAWAQGRHPVILPLKH